ncbi:MAG: hypothetical protein QXG00_00325 [Candidatus Woesearchaeota archaeon]
MIIPYKKSQIVGQVFIYIFAIIVVGFLALIGANLFKKITIEKCNIQETSFISNINKYIDIYSDYGSVHKEILQAPCNSKEICFVSTNKIGANGIIPNQYPIIKDSVEDGVQMNIFLVTSKETKPLAYSEKLEVDNGFLCISVGRGLKLTFTGNGQTTIVSETT